MPNYVRNAILKFQHDCPSKPEYASHVHNVPTYDVKVQYDTREENPEHLDDTERNIIQKIVGTFLYYGIPIDNIILTALSDIATKQSKVTKNTANKIIKLLNYLASNPDTAIQYHKSSILLYIHSDTSYLSVSKARSRARGNFFLLNNISAG